MINGLSVTCKCSISLDHPSATSSSLFFHIIPIEAVFSTKEKHHTRVTGLLLRTTESKQGQYYRVGVLEIFFLDGTGPGVIPEVILSHLQRGKYLGTNCYLDTEPDSTYAIEII